MLLYIYNFFISKINDISYNKYATDSIFILLHFNLITFILFYQVNKCLILI